MIPRSPPGNGSTCAPRKMHPQNRRCTRLLTRGLATMRSGPRPIIPAVARWAGLKDHSFGQVVDWGLGFLINSARYGAMADPYGYGKHASDATFGHGGMQSSAGLGDPENKIAAAIIFNGLPGEPKHQKRINDV